MNKKFWGVIIGVATVIALAASVWGISSFWHGYTSAETVHEYEQAKEIKLAMDKSQMAIDQQRITWLEERIFGMEQEYGCTEGQIRASCSGRIWRTYQKYIKEYTFLLEEINKRTTGD